MKKDPNIPLPLLSENKAVDWWFAFKFNTEFFEGCGDGSQLPNQGLFGGNLQNYDSKKKFSLQYVVSSNESPILTKGKNCLGTTLNDPLGATFNQVYNGDFNYVLWNDQFYNDPISVKTKPWGHSKGLLSWNDKGEGFVLQVSTPSWPGSGNIKHPRMINGNTLGYVKDDDVLVSQHFFALKLIPEDTVKVLKGLINARVVTDPNIPQIVRNGGINEIQDLVKKLGNKEPKEQSCIITKLSSGIQLISKPADSKHLVAPWQLVSAKLGGVPLRVANWWTGHNKIYSTSANFNIGCWNYDLGNPGDVEIATSGTWDQIKFGLCGGLGKNYNHAKLAVSTDSTRPYSIFGDMNQDGALTKNYAYKGQQCNVSQNGRGGTFYVLDNRNMFESLTSLLEGDTAAFHK